LSERRHRLYAPEIPEVKRGLKLRLRELCEVKEDRARAQLPVMDRGGGLSSSLGL
jgi:hypothetical protein